MDSQFGDAITHVPPDDRPSKEEARLETHLQARLGSRVAISK